MFTKTGLRPRELNSKTASSSSARSTAPGTKNSLPPVVVSPPVGGASNGVVQIARALRARRRNGEAAASKNSRGRVRRGQLASPSVASGRLRRLVKTPDAPRRGVSRGYSSSRVRRERSWSPRRARQVQRRPEWDDSLGDPSRYRLTPEEAARRKKSLVSKHNTLIFGQAAANGGGGGAKRVVTPRAPARGEENTEAGKGGRRRSSEGGSGFGSASVARHAAREGLTAGSDSILTIVPETEDDDVGTRGVNDETVTLFCPAKSGVSERPARFPASVASSPRSSRRLESGGSGATGSGKGDGSNGDGERERRTKASAATRVDELDLRGIETGIKAFSKRVSRLEACEIGRPSAVAPEVSGDERRRETCGREARTEPSSNNETTSGDENEGEAGCSTDPDAAVPVDVVQRVRMLEKQVRRLCVQQAYASGGGVVEDAHSGQDEGTSRADPVSSGEETTGAAGGVVEEEQDNALVHGSMEDMRALNADLLSLTAALLNRATAAEERLRRLAANGVHDDKDERGLSASSPLPDAAGAADDSGDASGDGRAIATPSSGDVLDTWERRQRDRRDRVSVLPTLVGKIAVGDAMDARDELDSCERWLSPCHPLDVSSWSVPTHISPTPRDRSDSATVTDCWGKALDAVGRLVDDSEDHVPADTAANERASPRSPPDRRRARKRSILAPLPLVSVAESRADRPASSESPSPIPLHIPGPSARLWRAGRGALAPPATTRESCGSIFGFGVDPDSRPATAEGVHVEEETQPRAKPAFRAPTPAKKPQHPFVRDPPMRSPRWLHQHVADAPADQVAPAFTVEGGRNGAVRGVTSADVQLPAIGQWYTPATPRTIN